MTTINLKDFYSWHTHDEYIEVSDEVAAELRADKLYEAAYCQYIQGNLPPHPLHPLRLGSFLNMALHRVIL